jgi:hypothetical protein
MIPGHHLKSRKLLCLLILLWVFGIGLGARKLLSYVYTPGRLAAPPAAWPGGPGIRPPGHKPVILVFIHPQCACSNATLHELAVIMTRLRGRTSAFVLFYAPGSKDPSWAHNDVWSQARAIPGVEVQDDREGIEARRFGAATSGQTLVYGAGGELLFNGGITAARGHAGDNVGLDAVVSVLESGAASRRTTPVFGCSLLDEESQ